MVRDHGLAEDLTQELTFIKAFRSMATFDPKTKAVELAVHHRSQHCDRFTAKKTLQVVELESEAEERSPDKHS